MNRNNHKNTNGNAKNLEEKKQSSISSMDFILGNQFVQEYGQYWSKAEKDNKVSYSISYSETSYGADITRKIGMLGKYRNLEETCHALIQYLKHPMMRGATKIKFEENKLLDNKYRRGYTVLSRSGITRIVIYEVNFIESRG